MHNSRRPRGNTWRVATLTMLLLLQAQKHLLGMTTPTCQITQGTRCALDTCCVDAATAAANAPQRGGNARKQLWKACACCVVLTEHRTARKATLMVCVLTRCKGSWYCIAYSLPAQVLHASPRGLSTKQAAGPEQARDEERNMCRMPKRLQRPQPCACIQGQQTPSTRPYIEPLCWYLVLTHTSWAGLAGGTKRHTSSGKTHRPSATHKQEPDMGEKVALWRQQGPSRQHK